MGLDRVFLLGLTALACLLPPRAEASQIAFPRFFQGIPANNLASEGQALSPSEALQLRLKGEDLSLLDPLRTPGVVPLWEPLSLPVSNAGSLPYPSQGAVADFVAYPLGVAPGLFRAEVRVGGRAFRLAISKTAHSALAMAGLLRKLGYKIDSPKWYSRLEIAFSDAKTREDFLARVGAATGADPAPTEPGEWRWVVEMPEPNSQGQARLVLQDVILESINPRSPPLQWSMLTAKAIAGRRELRGLATPFALFAVPESLNYYDWRAGRIESESWIVKFPQAEQFQEATIDDLRWSARRLLNLSESDWTEIVAEGRYPKAYEALILEVTKARRNDLKTKLQLESESGDLPFRFGLTDQIDPETRGEVVNGKVIRERLPGYAARFSYGDPDPILPLSEKLRYLTAESLEYGLGQAFSRLNDLTQLASAEDVFRTHQKDFTKKLKDLFQDNMVRQANGQSPRSLEFPANTFVGPLAGFEVDASRSVNIGTYYGSSPEYPVQMVDRLTVGAQAGVMAGMTLNESTSFRPSIPLQPLIEGSLKSQRSFIRVRPIQKVKEALEHDWKELFVPGFLGSLARVLEIGKTREASPSDSASNESTPLGILKTLASRLGSGLGLGLGSSTSDAGTTAFLTDWSDGQSPSDVLAELGPGADSPRPDAASGDARSGEDNLKDFLQELRPGEIFHIVDSTTTGVGAGVTLPLSVLIGAVPFGEPISVGFGLSGSAVVTRRTTLERKEDGLHVYLQQANMKGVTTTMSVSAIIKFLSVSRSVKSGRANDRAYLLDTLETTKAAQTDAQKAERKAKAQKLTWALKELLRNHNVSVLEENFEPYRLRHQWQSEVERQRFLFLQKSTYRQDSWLEVTPPADPARPELRPEQDARTFFSSRVTRREGINWFSFLKDSVPSLLKNANLSRVSSGNEADPASEFMGSATSSTIRTEGEVTSRQSAREKIPPVTLVEQHSTGWQMSRAEAVRVMERMERQFQPLKMTRTRLFRNEHLGTMNDIQLYDLSSTLLIYGEGMKRLLTAIAYQDGDTVAGLRQPFSLEDWNLQDGLDPALGGASQVCQLQRGLPRGPVMVYGPQWAFQNLIALWGPEKWSQWERSEGRSGPVSSSPGMGQRFRYSEKKVSWAETRGCLRKVIFKFCQDGREAEAQELQTALEGADWIRHGATAERYAKYCATSGFPASEYVLERVPTWMKRVLELRTSSGGTEARGKAAEIKRINERVELLLSEVDFPTLLALLGKENVFFQIRMTGFRQNLEQGDSQDGEFLSDSYGLFDERAAAGPLRQLIHDTGLSGWAVQGSFYSDGE